MLARPGERFASGALAGVDALNAVTGENGQLAGRRGTGHLPHLVRE